MVAKAGLGLTAATVLFARSALASAIDISSTGCVDVSGMNSCLSNAQSKFTSCMTAAGGDDEVSIACQWTEWVNQMLCYQQSCWNKIYSCEYQNLVASYVTAQTTPVSIPYYPAPDNAPGGCSCNIGDVFGNITANTNAAGGGCSKYVDGTSNSLFVCECCGWSAAVSAFYGICPDTSPDALGLSAFDKQAANFEQISGSCAGLTSDICAQYGFESEDNGKFLDPTNLPAGGTNPLSTTAGPSSLTSPPAGETITWALAGQTFVVTAAPYNGKNVAAGATTTGTAASATGTGSGSSSGSSSSSSSGSGSGSGSGSSSGSGSESSGATGTKATATGTTATGTILPSPIKTNAATKIQGLTEAWSVGLLSLIGVAAVL